MQLPFVAQSGGCAHLGWGMRAPKERARAHRRTRVCIQVQDIYCNCCDLYLGWKYEEAFEQSQKYKEGKAVLEKARMTREEWTPSPETELEPVGSPWLQGFGMTLHSTC